MTSAILAAALAAAMGDAAAAGVPETVDKALVPDYVRVRPSLAIAGQPTPEAVAKLPGLGFRTVVNLRAEGEPGVAEEKAAVEAAGMRYVHVPVTAATLKPEDVDAVARALADTPAGGVLLHCGSGNRAGGMWALLGMKDGQGLDAALAEGRKAGLKSEVMVEAVRRVAGPRP
jgi:uncharacterized protein (TIGR01244 family)